MGNITVEFNPVKINGKVATPVSWGYSPTGENGAMRDVYFTDEYVLKMGGPTRETTLFIEEQDRPYFAEVVYVDIHKQWFVQRRVIGNNKAPVTQFQFETILKMIEKYGLCDIGVHGVGDVWYKNWVADPKDNPVIYDYDYHSIPASDRWNHLR